MKHIKRLFIVVLVFVTSFVCLNTYAAGQMGYMYASDGSIIQSSVGYYVNEENIFNTLSDAWKEGFTEKNNIFNSPSDLFIYQNEETKEEVIYIVDSESNILFIFDKDLNYQDQKLEFSLNKEMFTNISQITKIRTNVIESNKSSSRALTTLRESGGTNELSENDYKTLKITCHTLSGVYRNKRPLRDDNNKILLDENGQTKYEDFIALCDAGNQQILILNLNFEVIQVISAPEGVDFTSKFNPVKVVTDTMGRFYVISTGIYEGILLMNYEGSFMSFVGVNYTSLSFWDALKRSRKTDEQLAQETTILQTIFNNLTIDSQGFLYTVSGSIKNADGTYNTEAMIKRINQTNNDVLKRNGYKAPIGDLITIKTGSNAGSSNFVAIDINDYGVYTVADNKANRLFTYDNEGNLLYISAGKGSQITDIAIPVALAYQGENILVLDKGNKCVMRYQPTDFAKNINKAVYYEYIGDSERAADEWANVIQANPAYELAYVGVGKKLYDEARYQEAMLYFQKGADVKYFSRAYKMYRDDIIGQYFPIVFTGIIVLACGGIVLKVVKKYKKKGAEEDEL